MSFLAIVLAVKIIVTAATIALPLLILPARRISTMTGLSADGATLFRLYGVALLALLVGYASGFWFLRDGEFPWGVVLMGIVSNSGAAAVLILTGSWRRSLLITTFPVTLAVLLCAAAVLPSLAMRPIW